MWKDAKYLLAYIMPLSAFWGVATGGIWSFAAIFVGFVAILMLEQMLPASAENNPPEIEPERSRKRLFDWLLYANVPLLYGLIAYYLHTLATADLTSLEITGMTCSVGLIVGTSGINVGHELGHRHNRLEQFLAKSLLLPALYLHFNIEHNRGHHKNVATDADPASARFGESL